MKELPMSNPIKLRYFQAPSGSILSFNANHTGGENYIKELIKQGCIEVDVTPKPQPETGAAYVNVYRVPTTGAIRYGGINTNLDNTIAAAAMGPAGCTLIARAKVEWTEGVFEGDKDA